MLGIGIVIYILINLYYLYQMDSKLILAKSEHKKPFWASITVSLCIAFLFTIAFGIDQSQAYMDWFIKDKNSHSGLVLTIITVLNLAIISILCLFKESSTEAQLQPSVYNENLEGIYKIDMKIPMIFNLVLGAFLLLNPFLPFLDILILGKK